jgi:hypothetical protein
MTAHGPGKGKRVVSTTLQKSDLAELARLAQVGGWRSTTAYIRAILEHHASQRQALAERRELYTIEETPPAAVADKPAAPYDPNTKGDRTP